MVVANAVLMLGCVCVQEIVTSDTLLSSFVPLLVSICSNLAKYPDADLRSVTPTLFLCKIILM
jgi:hypothetical protein